MRTSDLNGADFEGGAFVTMSGYWGTTKEIKLAKPGKEIHSFTRGATQSFSIMADDVGPITNVTVRAVRAASLLHAVCAACAAHAVRAAHPHGWGNKKAGWGGGGRRQAAQDDMGPIANVTVRASMLCTLCVLMGLDGEEAGQCQGKEGGDLHALLAVRAETRGG